MTRFFTALLCGALAIGPAMTVAQQTVTPILSSQSASFDTWLASFRARALAKGIAPRVLDRALASAAYLPDVVARDRNQAEFTREIWDYLDFAVSPIRIENGLTALRQQRRTLARIEAHYGVDSHIVAAVWGMESTYGTRKGDINTIAALATLAYDGRRGKFFEDQLIAALQILQAGDVPADRMLGSWAGAMGHTQFIPTSYLAYAVDFTGDGRRDIWGDDPTDALASTAAYLARHGWTKGQPWGVEVRLPKGFDTRQAKRDIRRAPSDWAAAGVTDMAGRAVPNHGRASILLPAGPTGPALMIFDNFRVIERYNAADAYVIGVGHLADRLAGKPEFQTPWPRGYAPLSFDERKELQERLIRAGYGLDKVDGVIGPQTVGAIRAYQQARGVPVDGFPSQDVLRLLKSR